MIVDETEVRRCTRTQNTECQCKPGYFCTGDEACEVCKKCKTCVKGDKMVKNCTAVANTECFRVPSPSGDTSNHEETRPKAFNDDNVDLGLGESGSENSLCVQNTLRPSPPASPVIPNRASPGTLHQPCAREKEGRGASLNHLLKQLRALNQNKTADEIKMKALDDGHYKLQVEE
ncbi:hypothetical protein CRUP_012113 [Coryphaenoides rupestris]|nr:hypothetical protein CRUP_012113 [Coryphaenoides rupestris]